MCIPLAVIGAVAGIASVGVGVAGVIAGSNAAKNQAQIAQDNLQIQKDNQQATEVAAWQRSEISSFDADQALAYGELNADQITKVAGLNNEATLATSQANINLINATTDFNVGVIRATTDFNTETAMGAAQVIMAQGREEQAAHEANANLDEASAQDALVQGQAAERNSRLGYAQLKSSQRASLAANGVALDQGSALRIQSDTDYASDKDASTIKANAIKSALGYRIQGQNEIMQGKFASLNANASALSKQFDAVAAKLNGEVAITKAKTEGAISALNTGMTASFNILQTDANAKIAALNTVNQSKADALSKRFAGLGYITEANNAARTGAQINPGSISPGAAQATSLLSGGSQVAGSIYSLVNSGAFSTIGNYFSGNSLPPY